MAIPSGYAALPYIESTGTQYIDTGFAPNQDTRVVIDFQSTQTTGGWPIIGSRSSSSSNTYTFGSTSTNNAWLSGYNTGSINSGVVEDAERHVADKNKNLLYLDGELIASSTYAAFTAPAAMRICRFYSADGDDNGYAKIKIYSCQIYDNGTLIRDYIPCQLASGEVGLWDDVNSVFYSDESGVGFTAGPLPYVASLAGEVGGTLVDDTIYSIPNGAVLGKTLAGGTAYNIKSGKTLVGGTAYDIGSAGTPISDLAAGSSVYLSENGTLAEYIVVNQGLPSSLYDSSCDGTWLLRKDIYGKQQWHSAVNVGYQATTAHSYLNGDFLALFDSETQSVIKQVKIPYANGAVSGSVVSGSSGLETKVFLLSGYELGWTQSNSKYFYADGACLDYFSGTSDTDAKRIAYFDGIKTNWWTRTPSSSVMSVGSWYVDTSGYRYHVAGTNKYGIRPALIISNDTMIASDGTLIA